MFEGIWLYGYKIDPIQKPKILEILNIDEKSNIITSQIDEELFVALMYKDNMFVGILPTATIYDSEHIEIEPKGDIKRYIPGSIHSFLTKPKYYYFDTIEIE